MTTPANAPRTAATAPGQVGAYSPHPDGRRLRSSPRTMMRERSDHIPTLTRNDATNSTATLRRARRHQKICGTTTLHAITTQ